MLLVWKKNGQVESMGRTWILPTSRMSLQADSFPECSKRTEALGDTLILVLETMSRESSHTCQTLNLKSKKRINSYCFKPQSQW